jgi:hypothetical protein
MTEYGGLQTAYDHFNRVLFDALALTRQDVSGDSGEAIMIVGELQNTAVERGCVWQ